MAQMSKDMWGDYGGNFGGLTWDQYANGTAPQQIGAFADWLNRSGSLTKGGGVDYASLAPELQFAYLMANQFGPNAKLWRNIFASGDMNTPLSPSRNQAGELGNLSRGAPVRRGDHAPD